MAKDVRKAVEAKSKKSGGASPKVASSSASFKKHFSPAEKHDIQVKRRELRNRLYAAG
jgi:hypothetical protein